MATTTNPNIGPRLIRTSNTPLYWGVAILSAVIIVLALLMRPTKVAVSATTIDPTTGAIIQSETNPTYDANRTPSGTNSRVKGMATDPRAEQLHNGENAPNGGIAPHAQPSE